MIRRSRGGAKSVDIEAALFFYKKIITVAEPAGIFQKKNSATGAHKTLSKGILLNERFEAIEHGFAIANQLPRTDDNFSLENYHVSFNKIPERPTTSQITLLPPT